MTLPAIVIAGWKGVGVAGNIMTAVEIYKMVSELHEESIDEQQLSGLLAIHELAANGDFDLLEHIPKEVIESAERISECFNRIVQAERERDAMYASFLDTSGLEKQLEDQFEKLDAGNRNLRVVIKQREQTRTILGETKFNSAASIAIMADHMKAMNDALAEDLGLGAKEKANVIAAVRGGYQDTAESMVTRMLMGDVSHQSIATLIESGGKYSPLNSLLRGGEAVIMAMPAEEVTPKSYLNALSDTIVSHFGRQAESETELFCALADWTSDLDLHRTAASGYLFPEHADSGILTPSVKQIFGNADIDKVWNSLPSFVLDEKTNDFLEDLAGGRIHDSFPIGSEARDQRIVNTFMRHYASDRPMPYEARRGVRLGIGENRDILKRLINGGDGLSPVGQDHADPDPFTRAITGLQDAFDAAARRFPFSAKTERVSDPAIDAGIFPERTAPEIDGVANEFSSARRGVNFDRDAGGIASAKAFDMGFGPLGYDYRLYETPATAGREYLTAREFAHLHLQAHTGDYPLKTMEPFKRHDAANAGYVDAQEAARIAKEILLEEMHAALHIIAPGMYCPARQG